MLAGAKLVEVGNTSQTFDWELDAAIGEKTAAVFRQDANYTYVIVPLVTAGA